MGLVAESAAEMHFDLQELIIEKPNNMWDKVKTFVENNIVIITLGTALAVLGTAFLVWKNRK